MKPDRVKIIAKNHPHYGSTGRFTGKVIVMKFTGKKMAEVKLENSDESCFVSPGAVGSAS